jgi:hypothetical protein
MVESDPNVEACVSIAERSLKAAGLQVYKPANGFRMSVVHEVSKLIDNLGDVRNIFVLFVGRMALQYDQWYFLAADSVPHGALISRPRAIPPVPPTVQTHFIGRSLCFKGFAG